ncbi:MAG: M20 family peptidase [Spirochaetes bacterium]|nr:M20 family peptidase [Spirochaetota bacterium]
MKINKDLAAEHLAGAIRFKTISQRDPAQTDRKAFLGLHGYLKKTYPKVHHVMKRETINELSLLYTWPGSDRQAEPILLMAHLDVVPAEDGVGETWTRSPFGGDMDGAFVWGRGALDVKDAVIGIMEAAEGLIADGFKPKRTVYISFGHDEEVLGNRGAAEISRVLAGRGVRLAFTLDEGGFIRDAVMPGLKKPAALVGIAEKGYLSLELSARDAGGHSSMPPRRTAAGRIARALCRLEKKPFPPRLTGPVQAMFRTLGSEAVQPFRIFYRNIGLFRKIFLKMLAASPQTDAMIRTTIAPTMLEGSETENVMPQRVMAVVNLRVLPGETREGVLSRVRAVIKDPDVEIAARENSSDPSPVSDTGSPEYGALRDVIISLFPGIVVAPFLMVGATDSRHFAAVSRQVFRFTPARIGADDMGRVHGIDERICIDNFADIIAFYAALIRKTAL